MSLSSLCLALIVAGLIARGVLRSPWFKGRWGEWRVASSLGAMLDQSDYTVFSDLTLPTSDGTTQVDHIVVSRFGIFVVETKNMKGWIFGDAEQETWTQVVFGRKSRFQNPLRQNYKHLRAVHDLLAVDAHKIHGVVAFVGTGVPKTKMPGDVVWGLASLGEYIKFRRFVHFDDREVERIRALLSELALQKSWKARRAHVAHVKNRIRERQDSAPRCPRCGAVMVERQNRATKESFLGCSRYPKCRGTHKLP